MVDTQCLDNVWLLEAIPLSKWSSNIQQHGTWYEQRDDHQNIIHQHHLGIYIYIIIQILILYIYHNKNIIIEIIHQLAAPDTFWHNLIPSRPSLFFFMKNKTMGSSPTSCVSPLKSDHPQNLVKIQLLYAAFPTEFQSFCLLGDAKKPAGGLVGTSKVLHPRF